ncbi:RDD family protein [Rhodobacterales bacterium HKCCSP123]|nr:RDD family protein [Rhodobacterales bacterium HKCCSP123]
MSTALPDPEYDHAFYDGVPAKRLFAWLVDVLLVTVITFLMGLLTLSVLWWIWPLTFIAVSFFYRAGSIAAWSATPGMQLMNIELRNSMGGRFSGGEAVLHTLAFMVATGFVILQIISIVMMVMGSRHQGLHDLLIGSAAINRPR